MVSSVWFSFRDLVAVQTKLDMDSLLWQIDSTVLYDLGDFFSFFLVERQIKSILGDTREPERGTLPDGTVLKDYQESPYLIAPASR